MSTQPIPDVVQITPRAIQFATESVAPPAPLYLSRDDRVTVRAWNSAAGVNLEIRGRLLMPDGEVSPFSFPFTPTTARALSSASFDLAEGFLLDVCVLPAAGTPKRGQCFVQVCIVRGAASNFELTQLLISDYVTSSMAIGYPGGTIKQSTEGPGFIRNIVGTNPAAGVEIIETCPTGARWSLLSMVAQLVTSATVANRNPNLIVDDGANAFAMSWWNINHTASLTITYGAGQGFNISGALNGVVNAPIASPGRLMAGNRFRTSTTGLQAGDDWGPPVYQVEEWIEI
jgi:hypothetical protein